MIRYFAQFAANGMYLSLIVEGPHLVPHTKVMEAASCVVACETPQDTPMVFKSRGGHLAMAGQVVKEKRVLDWVTAGQPPQWDWQAETPPAIVLAS